MSVEPPLMRDVLNGVLNSRVDASGLYSSFPETQMTPGELAVFLATATSPVASFAYPPGDVRRYGALGDGTTDDTAACVRGIQVLVQTPGGELFFPAGHTFAVSQILLDTMTDFTIRVEGVIKSNAAQHGTPFTDARGSFAGTFAVLKINACTNFILCGMGYVQNGFVEPLYMTSCTDFDVCLDLRGNGTNSTLTGVALRFCGQFVFHDMTVDAVTAQAMRASATLSGALLAAATSATVLTWAAGVGPFNVRFSNGDLRLVTFGAGTTNVSMSWSGGLTGAATSTVYPEIYFSWLNNFQIWDCSCFILEKVITRRAGMNGINPGSNCTDFTLQNNTCEYNSGSGIQVSWAAFGVFPSRFRILNNLLRFNQADGLDMFNGSGVNPAPIFAVIANNQHVENGWINCDPANPAGADGSCIGTFISLSNFTVQGNNVYESSNSVAYVQGCSLFVIDANVAQKTGGTNVGFGIHLIDCTDGEITANIVNYPAGEVLAFVNTSLRLTVRGNHLIGKIDTSLSISASGCTFKDNKVRTANTVTAIMPFSGNQIVYSGTGSAISIGGDSLSVNADTVLAASGTGISMVSRSGCRVENCVVQSSFYALLISGGAANAATSNYLESNALPAFQVDTAADRTFIQGNRINNTGAAFSINVDATATKTSVVANKIVAGPTNYGGTYDINFP